MFNQAIIRTVLTTKFGIHILSPILFPCKLFDSADYSEQMHPIAYAMHILRDVSEIKGWIFFCCGTNKWFCIGLKIRHKKLFVLHCSSCVAVQRGLLKW